METRVFDLNHDNEEQMIQQYQIDQPSAVGISIYTSSSFPEAVRLAKQFSTRTIAGGHHATAMPYETLKHFDSVVIGEGENAIIEAINRGGVIIAEPPELSSLPDIDYSFVNLDNYGINQSGKRTGTLITSRGCPYDCVFCGKLSRTVRFEPEDKVKRQIDTLQDAGFESLYFLDDVFTLKKDRMKRILEHTKVPYRVTTRANLVDPLTAKILSETGCELVSLGIESGNDNILKLANKRMTAQDNYFAVRELASKGIKTKGFFIIGLPGETEQTARQTIDFSLMLKDKGLISADFYFLTPFPGTAIWKNPEFFGIKIKDRDFTKYLQAGKTAKCVVETKELSSERIEELVNEARLKWK